MSKKSKGKNSKATDPGYGKNTKVVVDVPQPGPFSRKEMGKGKGKAGKKSLKAVDAVMIEDLPIVR